MTVGIGAGAIAAIVWLAANSNGSCAGRIAELPTVGAIAGLSLLVGTTGAVMAGRAHRLDRRRATAEHTFRAAQVELANSLQIARTEGEAFALLRHHLERTLIGGDITGAVLVEHGNTLSEIERLRVIDSVG